MTASARVQTRRAALAGVAVALVGCAGGESRDRGSPPADSPPPDDPSPSPPTAVATGPSPSPGTRTPVRVTVAALAEGAAPDRTLTYRTADGVALELDLFTPPGHERRTPASPAGARSTTAARARTGGPRPAMLMVHGGAWVSPGRRHTALHARYFARRGLVVGNVQYRLAGTETGWSVVHALRDVRAAFRTLRDRADTIGIDPERIVAAGESAGGHLAAGLATLPADLQGVDDPTPPAQLVLYNPVLDLTAQDWIEPDGDLVLVPESDRDRSWAERERLLSPIQHVRSGQPPALLLHGTDDRIVPIASSDRFADRYRDAGNAIRYERLQGRGHAFALYLDAGSRADVARSLRVTDRFLGQQEVLDGSPAIRACRVTATPSC